MSRDRLAFVGGTVIDGTGATERAADVLIEGDRIAGVIDPGVQSWDGFDGVVVDVTGRTVVPGFIDVHSHVDNAPLLREDDRSKILQGVTSEVVGNCGFSLAPVDPARRADLAGLLNRIFPPLDLGWSSYGELFRTLDDAGYVTNHAPLLGHNTVRVSVMGMSSAHATDDELRQMQRRVEQAVEAGYHGLSSGLIYPPGQFAARAELVSLTSRLRPGQPYVTHMRGEGAMVARSVQEAIAIARESGHPLHISHLKAAGKPAWGMIPDVLDQIDRARESGVVITHDVYPYLASSTMLTAVLPPWCQDGGNAAMLARLTQPAVLDQLRAELSAPAEDWENHVYGCGWDRIVVAGTRSHRLEGMSLADIAESLGTDPVQALATVLVQEELEASMIVFSMHEDDLIAGLRHPLAMVGSDGLPPGRGGKPHPRMWGTFPRIIDRYVRELKVLSMEEAVRKMTSLPADTFGLTGRGRVAPGCIADLAVIDLSTVADRASFAEPTLAPAGVDQVVLGGRPVVANGEYLGHRHGARLLPAGA